MLRDWPSGIFDEIAAEFAAFTRVSLERARNYGSARSELLFWGCLRMMT
jgi:hypothetical protein